MTINIVNPFKSQATRTFDKSKIGQDVHAGEYFPPAGVNLYFNKKIFEFGTATTVVDDNLSKAKPLERVKAVQSSSLFDVCADTRVKKQKKIISKVKSAKDNISKLFKPTGRVDEAFPCIDSFAIPSVEHDPTNDHSSSPAPSFIAQHAEPTACVVTTYESIPPRNTSLEIIASPIVFGENAVDEHVEGLASTFCSLVRTSFPPPAAQLFTTREFQLARIPSALFLGGLHTIEEEDGNTQVVVGVTSAQQKELATSDSHISHSDSDSEVTVYLSSDTLSDHSTPHGAGSVCQETSSSPVDTSFATSVDAEDSHQLAPGALRGLHRVPSYEDLRFVLP
ncbi:hypothetical protein HD554DRAFT_2037432 [Boletus coccyginus]|nr:hypothetical protein HD554DRAFT_2037432 [Boletus coccyginus]